MPRVYTPTGKAKVVSLQVWVQPEVRAVLETYTVKNGLTLSAAVTTAILQLAEKETKKR